MISRRGLLGFAATALWSCGSAEGERGVLRVGVLPNLTHAPLLSGISSGRLARALGLRLDVRVFRSGPRVTEALLGGAIDAGLAGPAPIVATHGRHPSALRVVSGCTSGGASFVVAPGRNLHSALDLRGAALAAPQLGSTPDVALRKYLAFHGLTTSDRGGDVTVHSLASADILVQMRRGALAGAWLPEPWATRLVVELGAERWVDERDPSRGSSVPTALLVVRSTFLGARRADVVALRSALAAEIARALAAPDEVREAAYREIQRLVRNAGARAVFAQAWEHVDFTTDPLPRAVAQFAADTRALGLCKVARAEGLFVDEVAS